MDFNNKKKKRRTRSVQDMYGIGIETRPSQKSAGGVRTMSYSNYTYKGDDILPEGGLGLFAFGGLLTLAIIVSCVFYMLNVNKEPFVYPTGVVTINGVLTDIYAAGSAAASSLTATDVTGTTTMPDGTVDASATDPAAGTVVGTGDVTALTGTTSTYPEATSHAELLTQIDNALSLGDKAFITNKLLCRDTSGNYIGYSVEAIDAFVTYMSANADKRSTFITSVADEATYSTVTQDVYYLTLPKISVSADIGYPDTTVSLTTFADAVADGTTPIEFGPLLPMNYTFTITNTALWANPTSKDIEVKLSDTVIPIVIKEQE